MITNPATADAAREVATATATAASAAGFVFLGIPQGMLIAAFLGAILSGYFGERKAEHLGWTIFGIIAVAFASAWVALLAMEFFPILKQPPEEAVAGGVAIGFHVLRRIFEAAATRYITKKAEELP